MIKGKKGSHVGVIASFGIFIIFLVGLYFVFEPVLSTQRSKQGLLDSITQDIRKELSSELTVAIIHPHGNCSILSNSVVNLTTPVYTVVKEEDGSLVPASFSGENLIIESRDENLWVYYSKVQINGSIGSDSGCETPEIKSVRKSQEIFIKKVEDAVSNFTDFKEKINIPSNSDFSFSFTLSNGSVLSAGEKNVSQEVYVDEIPLQYIDYKANNIGGKLILRVWTY